MVGSKSSDSGSSNKSSMLEYSEYELYVMNRKANNKVLSNDSEILLKNEKCILKKKKKNPDRNVKKQIILFIIYYKTKKIIHELIC